MINLPEWKLTLCEPLYDTASKSPIEMTAQVYGKMRELVTAYNEFASNMSKAFADYTTKTNGDIEEFKKTITCLMQEYIESVDTKINGIASTIDEMVAEEVAKQIAELELKYNEEAEEIAVGG